MSKRAFDIAQRVPMTVPDLLKIPGMTFSGIGQAESMQIWEPMARASFVLQSQKGYQGDPNEDLQALWKAGDLSGRMSDANGKIDVTKAQTFLDDAARIIAITHGLVTPQSMLGMAQQGGFALRGLSREGFMTEAIIAQMMGGPRAGTSLLSLRQQLAGTMMARTAKGLEDIGMLGADEWNNDHGHVIMSDAASKRLTGLVDTDPLNFVEEMVKHMREHGITDQQDQLRMLSRVLGRQTTQRMSGDLLMNLNQVLAERARMGGAMGDNDQFKTFMNESVGANMQALTAAWNNLLIAVAGPNSQNVISVLQTLTGAINSATKSINQMDPATLQNLGIGLAVLAGALTGAGIVALAAAIGPAGWIAAGLIGLGGALIMWWPQIKEFFVNFGNGLKEFGAVLAQGWKEKIDGIKNAIASFVDTIVGLYEKVKGFFAAKPDKAPNIYDQGVMGGLMHLNRFEPGTGQARAQPISLSLNVDGRTLAQAVSDLLDRSTTYPTGAPSPDGGGRHFAGDDNRWQT
jgi:hypothetical protein